MKKITKRIDKLLSFCLSKRVKHDVELLRKFKLAETFQEFEIKWIIESRPQSSLIHLRFSQALLP